MQQLIRQEESMTMGKCLFLRIILLIAAPVGLISCLLARPYKGDTRDDNQAKYVILMIGDGMGGWHVDATRKYLGRRVLAMESLRHQGYMTTFMRESVRKGAVPAEYWDDTTVIGGYDPAQGGRTPWEMVPSPKYVQEGATDSAAAAGAMASGHKQPQYALNVVPKALGYDGDLPFSVKYYPTIVIFAEALGKATGLVTSVPFNHATPAGFVVRTPFRKNQGEKARQMVYSDVDVIMGAGHPCYDHNGRPRVCDYSLWSENESAYLDDEDGKALYEKVKHDFKGRTYIEEVDDFTDLADGDGLHKGKAMPCRVFGVAQVEDTLQYHRNTLGLYDRDPSDDWRVGGQAYIPNVPTLEVMAKAALEVLEQDEDGFFLMVEGGAIDWASHESNMTRMLEENIDFEHAAQAVIDWVEDTSNGSNWQNTLVIVTADHECGHLQPVGHITGDEVINNQCWGVDCQKWGEHTNSLVPVYAQGPGAESLRARFNGDYRDNTDIFRTMYRATYGDGPMMSGADP